MNKSLLFLIMYMQHYIYEHIIMFTQLESHQGLQFSFKQ